MNRIGRGTVMLFLGLSVGRLVIDGRFGDFVQQRMRWPLAVATVVVIVLGLTDVVRGLRARDDQAQRRSVGPRVGWLLALPVLVLVTVAPTALGAAAADRVAPYRPTAGGSPDLLPEGDPFAMRVVDFARMAVWDDTGALEGRQVILDGIVVDDGTVPGGFVLARFLVSCCAADGVPIKIAVHGAGPGFVEDQWVRATVTLREQSAAAERDGIIEVDAVAIVPLDGAPDAPYETL